LQGPWNDWIPGVLNRDQVRVLCDRNFLQLGVAFDSDFLDESSIDLHLSDEAYSMCKGAVKPSRERTYKEFLDQAELATALPIEHDNTFSLNSRKTYVFKLRERLGRQLADLRIFGQATAKSSVGRVDVLARLIVDGMDTYESFTPKALQSGSPGSGEMYLEVTPITFDVQVKTGTSLSQLRLFYGDPKNAEVIGPELFMAVFGDDQKSDGSLNVEISNLEVEGRRAAAFCAGCKDKKNPAVPLWTAPGQKRGVIDPTTCWQPKACDDAKRLEIQSEEFYILRSKERISVPKGIAVYCRASDETIGEMRIHYAGFVHPWFGRRRAKGKGTPLIFEVRGHQVNVSLSDGKKMANLTFYRMSEDAPEPTPSPYEDQELELSKFFAPWPPLQEKEGGAEDGNIKAG
jgi:dCTP deaminase